MLISPCSLTWQAVFDLGTREQARNSRSSSSPAVAWARYFLYRCMSWQFLLNDRSRTWTLWPTLPFFLFYRGRAHIPKKQCSGSLGSVIVCTDPDLGPAPETDPSIEKQKHLISPVLWRQQAKKNLKKPLFQLFCDSWMISYLWEKTFFCSVVDPSRRIWIRIEPFF